MKVLIVGFLKTGTKSMSQALRILGYNVSEHGRNFGELEEDWKKFLYEDGNFEDLREMYEGYDAMSDTFAIAYWKEFLKAFPDIKLILTQREASEVARSFNKQYSKYNDSSFSFPLSVFSSTARGWFDFQRDVIAKFCPPSIEKRRFEIQKKFPVFDEATLINFYDQHNNDVIKNAPRDQLLICNIKDGWEPLCQFLGHQVPNVPFPHENQKCAITDQRLKYDIYVKDMYKEMYITLGLLTLSISLLIAFMSNMLW